MVVQVDLTDMQAKQAALERQDLSCTYLAHHQLESVFAMITIPAKRTTGGRASGVMDTLGDVSMYVMRNLFGVPE